LLNRLDVAALHDAYARFPFEGTAVYRQRHHDLIGETSVEEQRSQHELQFRPLRDALRRVEVFAREVGLGGEPSPYVAVMVADGDKMGAAISGLSAPTAHQEFSRELTRFAAEATRIVRDQHGVLVYSGGDDVLAFAPVDKCLTCARALHTLFHETMAKAFPDTKAEDLPTLSVGIAVGHFMENLEDLLAFGRAAEKHAKKPDRNGLGVHLHKRGGSPVKVRKQWTDNPDKRLATYADWFLDNAISNRTPYELHRLATVYENWPTESLRAAITRDAVRVIEKKRPGGEKTEAMQKIRAAVEGRVNSANDLRELADELLIARQLGVAPRQSGGGRQQ
jgi:CRISPR-associated protein Cmr2